MAFGRWITERNWEEAGGDTIWADRIWVGLARQETSDVPQAVNIALNFTDEDGQPRTVVAVLDVNYAQETADAIILAIHEVSTSQ